MNPYVIVGAIILIMRVIIIFFNDIGGENV